MTPSLWRNLGEKLYSFITAVEISEIIIWLHWLQLNTARWILTKAASIEKDLRSSLVRTRNSSRSRNKTQKLLSISSIFCVAILRDSLSAAVFSLEILFLSVSESHSIEICFLIDSNSASSFNIPFNPVPPFYIVDHPSTTPNDVHDSFMMNLHNCGNDIVNKNTSYHTKWISQNGFTSIWRRMM